MKSAALFDLGNTLVAYYERAEFPAVLAESIGEAKACLARRGSLSVADDVIGRRVAQEDYEAEDFRVRPLEGRLSRIFGLNDSAEPGDLVADLCRCFLRPVFARAQVYGDSVPALQALRGRGLKTAVVSNTPWGSPADLWREELERLGLAEHLDAAVFCRDAGWRKPDRRIFERALRVLGVAADEALFVGDDPRWDSVGAAAAGMDAVLIDRGGTMRREKAIHSLQELWEVLSL
jgi:putative hydrolase of the HAD superfamily